MKTWKRFCGGLAAVAGLTPSLWAQELPPVPVIPSPAAAAAGIPASAATAAPPAGGNTLWSFLGISKAQKAVCKMELCQTPLGQLLNNTMAPMSALSGGMVGGFCPKVDPGDLLKPPTSAEGAAARIKASELDAKKRRAAVRYLGTVDCQYWPEAEDALVKSLRADTNECVRFEAALALNRGCCCTKKIITALTETVEGGKKLGPAERSERVKTAATSALEHCLACVPPEATPKKPIDNPLKPGDLPAPKPVNPTTGTPPTDLPGGLNTDKKVGRVEPAAYYAQIEATPVSQLQENARHALAGRKKTDDTAAISMSTVRGERSLYSILTNARNGTVHAAAPRSAEAVEASSISAVSEANVSVQPPLMPVLSATPTSMPVPPPAMLSTPLTMPAPQPLAPAYRPAAQPSMHTERDNAAPAPQTTAPAYRPTAPQTMRMAPEAPAVSRQFAPAPVSTLNFPGKDARSVNDMQAPRNTCSAEPQVSITSTPSFSMSSTPAVEIGSSQAEFSDHSQSGRIAFTERDVAPVQKPAYPVVVVSAAAKPSPASDRFVVQASARMPETMVSGNQDDISVMREWLPHLRRWDHPELRERAAMNLQRIDWRTYPEVVDGLLAAAVEDKATSVRVVCIRALVKMNVRSQAALTTMEKLKSDNEPTVRDAAVLALVQLKRQ